MRSEGIGFQDAEHNPNSESSMKDSIQSINGNHDESYRKVSSQSLNGKYDESFRKVSTNSINGNYDESFRKVSTNSINGNYDESLKKTSTGYINGNDEAKKSSITESNRGSLGEKVHESKIQSEIEGEDDDTTIASCLDLDHDTHDVYLDHDADDDVNNAHQVQDVDVVQKGDSNINFFSRTETQESAPSVISVVDSKNHNYVEPIVAKLRRFDEEEDLSALIDNDEDAYDGDQGRDANESL